MAAVRSSVEEFDDVARRLLKHWEGDANVSKVLKNYIEGCRFYCTGNLSWR